MIRPATKSRIALALLCAVGLFIILVPVAQGQSSGTGGPTQVGGIGGWLGSLIGWTQAPGLLLWGTILYLIKTFFAWVLGLSAFLMNNIFYYNVVLNPANMPIVQEGWSITRDIVNSLYILVVLWIALTIIFDIENLGGKKLLSKVIISALLVNFSLAILGVIFGTANVVAARFHESITANGDLAGFVMNRVKFQTIDILNITSADTFKQNVDAQGGTRCGFSALGVTGQQDRGCLGASDAGQFASQFMLGLTNQPQFQWPLGLAIQIFFLILMVTSFLGVFIMLLLRIIYMTFLGIVAPLAFLAIGVPGGKTHFDRWMKTALCWAFNAPVFYFLFFLALKMLVAMTNVPVLTADAPITFMANMIQMLPLLVFLGLLWFAMMSGKYMGCKGADMAMSFGKKIGSLALGATAGLALGATTGGLGLLGKAAAGRALAQGGAAEKLAGAAGRIPLVGKQAELWGKKKTASYRAQQKGAVESQAKELEQLTTNDRLAGYFSSHTDENRARYVKAMSSKNELGKLLKEIEDRSGGDKEKQEKAITTILDSAKRFGTQDDVLQNSPHILKYLSGDNYRKYDKDAASLQDAITRAVAKVKDKTEMALPSKSDPMVLAAMLATMKGKKELERIGREDVFLYRNLVDTYKDTYSQPSINQSFDVIDKIATPGTSEARREMIKNYFESHPGRILVESKSEESRAAQQDEESSADSQIGT